MVEWKGIEPSTFAQLSQRYLFNNLRAVTEKAKMTFVTAFGPPAWASYLPEVYTEAMKVCPESAVTDLGHVDTRPGQFAPQPRIEPMTPRTLHNARQRIRFEMLTADRASFSPFARRTPACSRWLPMTGASTR